MIDLSAYSSTPYSSPLAPDDIIPSGDLVPVCIHGSRAISKIVLKDPAAVRTYAIDWGRDLPGSATIAAVAWSVPAGITVVEQGTHADAIVHHAQTYPAGTLAMARLSGGTAGQNYNCICHITTTSGDEDERTLVVSCRER